MIAPLSASLVVATENVPTVKLGTTKLACTGFSAVIYAERSIGENKKSGGGEEDGFEHGQRYGNTYGRAHGAASDLAARIWLNICCIDMLPLGGRLPRS
jgi:hypothetical protein